MIKVVTFIVIVVCLIRRSTWLCLHLETSSKSIQISYKEEEKERNVKNFPNLCCIQLLNHKEWSGQITFVSYMSKKRQHESRGAECEKSLCNPRSMTVTDGCCCRWSGPGAKAPVALQQLGLLYTLFSGSSPCRCQMSPCPTRCERSEQREVEL
jgi:hypothetical protein